MNREQNQFIMNLSRKLIALCQESENAKNLIENVPGPWEKALIQAIKIIKSDNVVVYLDAPYKREEYSRIPMF